MANKNVAGMICALLGGTAWGFSGSCGQLLFEEYGLEPTFVCSIRIIVAAICLFVFVLVTKGKAILEPLRSRRNIARFFAYAFFGILFTQLAYLVAISHSNAGTATALEYIGPVLVVLVVCVRKGRMPNRREVGAVLCVIVGTFLLAMHGDPTQLVLSPQALFWGLLTALSIVFYTLLPEPLLKKYDAPTTLTWAFLIDAVFISVWQQPWAHLPVMSIHGWVALVGGLSIIGTLIAFLLYFQAIKLVGPTTTSMLASIEVPSATLFSAFWLGTSFTAVDLVGMLVIASTALLLGSEKQGKTEKMPSAQAAEASLPVAERY